MKPNRIGIGAVVLAVAAVLAYKSARPVSTAAAPARSPAVILVADPSEADAQCGCGEIIRSIRAAAARGVVVREAAPGSDPSLEALHRITVSPTVLFLDQAGSVRSRFEGEEDQSVAGIREALERLGK